MPVGATMGIISAVKVGTDIYSAHKAANASKESAKIQSDAANKAIDYSQRATNQSLDFLQQNQARANGVGPSAPRSALSQLLGLNPTTAGGGTYQPMMPTNTAPITGAMPRPPASPFTMSGQTPQGGMVLMRAPNGMQKRVNAADVEHYKQAGAQVIQ